MKLFFQNKSDGRQESGPGIPLSMELPCGAPGGAEQIPPFYQMSELLAQGAQSIAAVSQNSIFHGNVETTDDIAVFGRLEGDISGAAARIFGTVVGTVRCGSMQAAGTVEGDIFSAGPVEISAESRITGNIRCERAVISGAVTGDVEAAQSVVLTETAVLNGDLRADEIEIRKGAALHGLVKIERSELCREQSAGQAEEISQPEPIVL